MTLQDALASVYPHLRERVQKAEEVCRQKQAFFSVGQAAETAKRVKEQGLGERYAYACPVCKMIHLASKNNGEANVIG